ncbi:hypothetical protein EJ08DRAFT_645837 [Tothia fuscella]|uniref:Uncharacterized protein n=1 Tax=Tothia fuscella TaxID=1048955 RepID=A0A9P4U345_9PEZI|nr:hypothetical protein EJ08DRAFT_645837 [Tothia fuscella]
MSQYQNQQYGQQYNQQYSQQYPQQYTQQYAQANSYFVPGFGISRAIIQSEIQYLCGPDAVVRPYTHQGRDGFLVTTAGPPLTKEQIEDLKDASREYEERQAERTAEQANEWFVNKPVAVGHRSRR